MNIFTSFFVMSEEPYPVVIDSGSGYCRAGYSGYAGPQTVVRSIIGRINFPGSPVYVADDAIANSNILDLTYPIERGIITNWDDMIRIWNKAYNNLNITSSEHSVVLTDSVAISSDQREKMIEVMFETYNVPTFYVAYQPLLSLYANNILTGVVLEIGDELTQVVPIYNNNIITEGIRTINFGGRDITSHLQNLLILGDGGGSLMNFSGLEIVRDIKEKHCYVAYNYQDEFIKAVTTNECTVTYTQPNGTTTTVNTERFAATETLFNPQEEGFSHQSVQQAVYNSIMACNADIRNSLFTNIFVAGGTTNLSGLTERLKKEMTSLVPQSTTVNVYGLLRGHRTDSAWLGGSIVAETSIFQQNFITRADYDEYGAEIVHQRCG